MKSFYSLPILACLLQPFFSASANALDQNFDVTVRTKTDKKAGTDETVTVKVWDANNNEANIVLVDEGGRYFEKGATDDFKKSVSVTNFLGPLTRAQICLSNLGTKNSGWVPFNVVVNQVTFPLDRTLDAGQCADVPGQGAGIPAPSPPPGQQATVSDKKFNVVVRTNFHNDAGTDETITLKIYDEKNIEAVLMLADPDKSRFEKGNADIFPNLSAKSNQPFGTPTRLNLCLSKLGTGRSTWEGNSVVINNVEFPIHDRIGAGNCKDSNGVAPPPVPKPNADEQTFEIVVGTAKDEHSGTDETVTLKAYDANNNMATIVLADESKDKFERGKTNSFVKNGKASYNFGVASRLQVCLSNMGTKNGGWRVDFIIINQALFTIGRDLKEGECLDAIGKGGVRPSSPNPTATTPSPSPSSSSYPSSTVPSAAPTPPPVIPVPQNMDGCTVCANANVKVEANAEVKELATNLNLANPQAFGSSANAYAMAHALVKSSSSPEASAIRNTLRSGGASAEAKAMASALASTKVSGNPNQDQESFAKASASASASASSSGGKQCRCKRRRRRDSPAASAAMMPPSPSSSSSQPSSSNAKSAGSSNNSQK